MMHRSISASRSASRAFPLLFGLLIYLSTPSRVLAEPTPAALTAFNSYVHAVETRLTQQHRSAAAFLAPVAPVQESDTRLRRGEIIIEERTPSGGLALPGALLHHWRATAFVPGADADSFAGLLKNVEAYPAEFSPQVVQARVLMRDGDRLKAWMRVRQHHVITVEMDTTYDVNFGKLDAQHGYSISRSTQISELDSSGHAVDASQDHGFLWRQNTYWSYEERDGGLYIQVESVSLTRSIPTGLGWMVGPFIESVPRQSLEFTLRSACSALHKKMNQEAKDLRDKHTEEAERKQG
jgi:hypothetical protein